VPAIAARWIDALEVGAARSDHLLGPSLRHPVDRARWIAVDCLV
jgi:hypothetical protein